MWGQIVLQKWKSTLFRASQMECVCSNISCRVCANLISHSYSNIESSYPAIPPDNLPTSRNVSKLSRASKDLIPDSLNGFSKYLISQVFILCLFWDLYYWWPCWLCWSRCSCWPCENTDYDDHPKLNSNGQKWAQSDHRI